MALLSQPASLAACSSLAKASRTRVRLRAALSILLAVNVLLLFFWFRSPGRTEAQRREDIARLQEQLHAAQLRVEQLSELRQKVRDATSNEQQFTKANFLSRETAFSEMLFDLERLATENHLQPGDTGFRLDDGRNQLGWITVGVTLTLDGEYPDLVRFLNRLEQSELFWIVEGLTVSGRMGQKLRLNLQAATYVLPS
jgi:Tfp pilus assembly protein PilO